MQFLRCSLHPQSTQMGLPRPSFLLIVLIISHPSLNPSARFLFHPPILNIILLPNIYFLPFLIALAPFFSSNDTHLANPLSCSHTVASMSAFFHFSMLKLVHNVTMPPVIITFYNDLLKTRCLKKVMLSTN